MSEAKTLIHMHLDDDLREKTTMAGMQAIEADTNLREQIRLQTILYQEENSIRTDAPRNLKAVSEGMMPAMQEQIARAAREDEDEVLQTRVISNADVWFDSEAWIPPTEKEIKSLVDRQVIRRLSLEEAKEQMRTFPGKVEIISGKAVYTVKAPDGRKKCRLVVCGNFVGAGGEVTNSAEQTAKRRKDPDLYAGGADAIALRAALAISSKYSWNMGCLDVKTAFLNADLGEGARPSEEEKMVLMQPPKILVRLNLAKDGELWAVDKALYGFRESPRDWAAHRDNAMREMREEFQLEMGVDQRQTKTRRLIQCTAEENFWMIVEAFDEQGDLESYVLLGMVLVYVDDFMLMGYKDSIVWFEKKLREKWEVTDLEWAGDQAPLRFCASRS